MALLLSLQQLQEDKVYQGCQVQKIKNAKFGHKQTKKAKFSKIKKCQIFFKKLLKYQD